MQDKEFTGVHIETHIKIWDPTTSEIFISTRA